MQTIHDIPSDDRQRILDKVLSQINSMDAAELKIIAQTEQSLADFVAQVFQSFAKLLGYVIAYPIALGLRVAESIEAGLTDGWRTAFKNAGIDPK